MDVGPRIVLAVTSAKSLRLLQGWPDYLLTHGWDVHIVVGEPADNETGARLHVVEMKRQPAPIADAIALWQWVKLLRRLRPDVVVAGTPKAGLLGVVASRINRVPVRVYLLRGLRLETETGALRVVLWTMERLAAAASTGVQCVSESLMEAFVKARLCPRRKAFVVGPGSSNGVVVHSDLGNAVSSATREQAVVGFVGRVTADKGIDTFTKAIAINRRNGVYYDAVVVGGEEPEGVLRDTLAAAGLEEQSISWKGHVADPQAQMRRMSLLVLPTLREGFPNVVLEAAVEGVPAIVSDATGARDSVLPGVTGEIVRAGDAEALARAIHRLVEDRPRLAKMSTDARDYVSRTYRREEIWRLNRLRLQVMLSHAVGHTTQRHPKRQQRSWTWPTE